MECESVTESTMDSIDVTIFEDFYSLDITMPFTGEFPKTDKTQLPDPTAIVSVPASPSKSTELPQIISPEPQNEPLPISTELPQTPSRSPPASQSVSPKEPDEHALELSPNSPSEYSSLSPMKSMQISPKSEYKSIYDIPSESVSNLSVASSPESPTLSMEFFANALSMSPKITPEAIPIASPKKTPVSFRSSSKLEMSSKSIGLQSNTKVSQGMLPKSTSGSSLKSSKKISPGLKSTSKQNSLPKLLSNSPLVPHTGPGSIFTPHFSVSRTKSMSRNVSCRKRILIDEPLIVFSPDVNPQPIKPSTINRTRSSPSCSVMKENKVPTKLPNRFESPTEIHKSLLLHQVSGRTNHSPIYTPFTSMVSRFKNLAIESPFIPAGKVNVPNESSKKVPHKTRVEKIKLISPLLRSPKLKIISTKLPLRSNSKVTNSVEKKSPTIAQYKAKSPVIQGSRIPVLKLN